MPLIVSCFANSYGRFGTQAAIENVKAAGIDYVELPIRTEGVKPFFGDVPMVTNASGIEDLKVVDVLLEKNGVKVSSCNLTTGNPLERKNTEIIKRKLELASHFGVTKCVGDAGKIEDDSQLHTLYSHLREIGDHAAKHNITFCFETHPGICQDHRGMYETMEALQHANLRLNFDTGNLFYYNDYMECEVALAKVCHLVGHVHLKDCQGERGAWYFPALGNGGAVDFVRVLELLTTCGFMGPFSLEIEGIEGEGELTLEQHQQRIVDSAEHLKSCGYLF
ncbi:MAG: xylose isomerase [Planctomycetaceae bacterium]|nr:xylose isomerase [Planctomycetaceae bacterium]